MADDNPHRRLLHGRRQGHRLSNTQADLVHRLLPALRITMDAETTCDPFTLYPPMVEDVWLEIGFGGGEHLAWQARSHENIGFIGCEPFINGVAKLLREIDRHGLTNIRIHDDDARDLLDALDDRSLGRVFLLYPDPWPKKRHHKRRFISHDNLKTLARVMKPGAELRVASDIPDFVRWTLQHIRRSPDFEWCARRPADWRSRPADWPQTRYEAKARREGRVPAYLVFRRN